MVFHHVATDGEVVLGGEDEDKEVMKSEMMAFWEGLKLPYQMRLMAILPERRGPLWYFKSWVWSWTSSLSFLVAKETWKNLLEPKETWIKEATRKSFKREEEEPKTAIFLLGFLKNKEIDTEIQSGILERL